MEDLRRACAPFGFFIVPMYLKGNQAYACGPRLQIRQINPMSIYDS